MGGGGQRPEGERPIDVLVEGPATHHLCDDEVNLAQ